MLDLILMLLGSLIAGVRGQAALQAENIALRHQLTVLQRTQLTKRRVRKPVLRQKGRDVSAKCIAIPRVLHVFG